MRKFRPQRYEKTQSPFVGFVTDMGFDFKKDCRLNKYGRHLYLQHFFSIIPFSLFLILDFLYFVIVII